MVVPAPSAVEEFYDDPIFIFDKVFLNVIFNEVYFSPSFSSYDLLFDERVVLK